MLNCCHNNFTIMVNGCGKKDESAVNYEEPLTYWVSFNSAALGVENFENLPPMKKLMERTGVNLKFLHPISVWNQSSSML